MSDTMILQRTSGIDQLLRLLRTGRHAEPRMTPAIFARRSTDGPRYTTPPTSELPMIHPEDGP